MAARTESRWGNCIQQMAWLLLSRNRRLLVLKSQCVLWPIHVAYRHPTREKRYISFETTWENNKLNPWWFIGNWREISRERSDKRRYFELPHWAGLIFMLLLIAILIIPWYIGWACYQPVWMIFWTIKAFLKRKGK